jgi:hypothetical protein
MYVVNSIIASSILENMYNLQHEFSSFYSGVCIIRRKQLTQPSKSINIDSIIPSKCHCVFLQAAKNTESERSIQMYDKEHPETAKLFLRLKRNNLVFDCLAKYYLELIPRRTSLRLIKLHHNYTKY